MYNPLGVFTDEILGYANNTLATIHHKFAKQIWGDNNITAKLKNNQSHTNWQEGTYEVYIPTFDSPNYNLKYYRIAIKVLYEISDATKRQEAIKMTRRIQQPLGEVESELICLIAYKQDKPGIVKGFPHSTKKGFFTGVFVSGKRSPTLIWKRVIDHIANFVSKKLDGLMRSLKFETWMWKWLLSKNDNCFTMNVILKHFSLSIQQSVISLIKLFQHLCDKMRLVLGEIGVLNVALSKTCREIRDEIAVLQKALKVRVEREVQRDCLRVLGVIPYG